ncbi:RNA polymerase sigma-70 factor [Flammeovirgaceae bacterium SG7u.111]|nr:RNA polymerase sigma-70 factor [Flammeovirgaceae bacterium SG7u.132]WPO37260.1 RNA polymerase sigma-70 factor [Flammeovirgaceae bacterium SG7u.111]
MQLQKKESDEFLIERIKGGEKQALETLFDRYFEVLCDFSYQFLKSKDLSEEAVSDVFIKVWENKHQISIQSGVKAYLYRAARNQSLNYLKKEGADLYTDLSEATLKPSDSEHLADQLLMFDELQKSIENIIDKMPKQRKLIFRMNRLDGMKYQEIAEVLGISVNTVQNHMVEATSYFARKYPRPAYLKTLVSLLLLFLFV